MIKLLAVIAVGLVTWAGCSSHAGNVDANAPGQSNGDNVPTRTNNANDFHFSVTGYNYLFIDTVPITFTYPDIQFAVTASNAQTDRGCKLELLSASKALLFSCDVNINGSLVNSSTAKLAAPPAWAILSFNSYYGTVKFDLQGYAAR